jgi:aspartate-semialdehyde dehydrogenase
MFGVKQVVMTSLQAMSGARRTPGLSVMDMTENVILYIVGEEPKVETEPQKILGKFKGETIEHAPFGITATCTRVPVARRAYGLRFCADCKALFVGAGKKSDDDLR